MSDVFEEVEEGLRRDKYADFFRKYAVWLIAGVAAVLAAVGGYQAIGHWRAQQGQGYAEELAAAEDKLAAGDLAGAEKALDDLAKRAPAGYKTAALLHKGGVRQQQGDAKGAIAAFEQAAKIAPSPIFHDLAVLRAAYAAADAEDVNAIEARVKPLIDAAGAFSYQARELVGMQALAAGDIERAREQFDYLNLALETPDGVRQRARTTLSMLGPKPEGASPPADAPNKTGAKP
ncbi:MAG: tetratricopeptide repeat protein [Hyphomonadaceae bacterium]